MSSALKGRKPGRGTKDGEARPGAGKSMHIKDIVGIFPEKSKKKLERKSRIRSQRH